MSRPSTNTPAAALPWGKLERTIRHDPSARGLASHREGGRQIGIGQLRLAAEHLADQATCVAIVTGFVVNIGVDVGVDVGGRGEQTPAAETDGPPGALYLARAMLALGIDVTLVSDEYGTPLLEAGCDHWQLGRERVCCMPFENDQPASSARQTNHTEHSARSDAWVEWFYDEGPGRSVSHVIAIERVGPSHTPQTLAAQSRDGAAPRAQFEDEVPAASHNVCHNMRGDSINAHTAKTHRLFEAAGHQTRPLSTIGIGDGGNEIGLGSVPWEQIRAALGRKIGEGEVGGGEVGGRIACRIATDFTLLAGVSNWAAYALAQAVCRLRGKPDALRWSDAQTQQQLIETLVAEAGAVDGVTRRSDVTVDGLAMDEYLRVFSDIARVAAMR
ncbi:MAG: DUF4392 domain-containing protein [Planctomycetes bacterium]|nr:DUF4392 domain-containing protein [Planctomycetota bacterium]